MKKSRSKSEDRVQRLVDRNKLIVGRFYYHNEIKRLRFDDTIRVLCEKEFFIGERTVSNALQDTSFSNLLKADKKAYQKLTKTYPGFCWR